MFGVGEIFIFKDSFVIDVPVVPSARAVSSLLLEVLPLAVVDFLFVGVIPLLDIFVIASVIIVSFGVAFEGVEFRDVLSVV